MSDRVQLIKQKLEAHLIEPSIDIEDQSHLHAGHEGAKGGGGHFAINVVSASFEGKNPIQRHRLVYEAMGDAMKKEIHALSINAKTPNEI